MKKSRLEELIEKYFDGETTIHEEEALQRYFSNTERSRIPKEVRQYSDLFAYFGEERNRVSAVRKGHKSFRYLLSASVVAASIALISILWLSLWQQPEPRLIVVKIGGVEIDNKYVASTKVDKSLAKFANMMSKVHERSESLKNIEKMNAALLSVKKIGIVMTQNTESSRQ